MIRLVLATQNPNKVKEIRQMIASRYELVDLGAIGCTEEIPETSPTLEANALQKARYVHEHYQHCHCFAEDTGLEVDALNGAPGVYTARYAGPEKDNQANIRKLLAELDGQTNRQARFRTVIALILDGKEYLFEGIAKGVIALQASGTEGFGYDPVFVPEGYDQTFAELSPATKHAISHRGKAVQQLIDFLAQYTPA